MKDRRGTPASNFNTPLSWDEELKFQKWKEQHAPHDSGEDYDLRGAFLGGEKSDQRKGEHGSDRWKKPNHPTFSEESQYAAHGRAGRWSQQEPSRESKNWHGLYIPEGGLLKQQLLDDTEAARSRPARPKERVRHWEDK